MESEMTPRSSPSPDAKEKARKLADLVQQIGRAADAAQGGQDGVVHLVEKCDDDNNHSTPPVVNFPEDRAGDRGPDAAQDQPSDHNEKESDGLAPFKHIPDTQPASDSADMPSLEEERRSILTDLHRLQLLDESAQQETQTAPFLPATSSPRPSAKRSPSSSSPRPATEFCSGLSRGFLNAPTKQKPASPTTPSSAASLPAQNAAKHPQPKHQKDSQSPLLRGFASARAAAAAATASATPEVTEKEAAAGFCDKAAGAADGSLAEDTARKEVGDTQVRTMCKAEDERWPAPKERVRTPDTPGSVSAGVLKSALRSPCSGKRAKRTVRFESSVVGVDANHAGGAGRSGAVDMTGSDGRMQGSIVRSGRAVMHGMEETRALLGDTTTDAGAAHGANGRNANGDVEIADGAVGRKLPAVVWSAPGSEDPDKGTLLQEVENLTQVVDGLAMVSSERLEFIEEMLRLETEEAKRESVEGVTDGNGLFWEPPSESDEDMNESSSDNWSPRHGPVQSRAGQSSAPDEQGLETGFISGFLTPNSGPIDLDGRLLAGKTHANGPANKSNGAAAGAKSSSINVPPSGRDGNAVVAEREPMRVPAANRAASQVPQQGSRAEVKAPLAAPALSDTVVEHASVRRRTRRKPRHRANPNISQLLT